MKLFGDVGGVVSWFKGDEVMESGDIASESEGYAVESL